MLRALILPALVLAFAALFLRSYTVPPAPDRRGGTVVSLNWPNRPLFGSARGDCIDLPEDQPVIGCLIASVARSRQDGIPLLQLGFCATCYGLSQRLATLGRDEASTRARLTEIGRFGW
ncbi:hypothetical protein MKK58_21205 [Methylobacterium sp. J-078]|uniref:hypothetical protein n=1 Tax=Methylobacterium sp. J-078 TaxID=2836657 RepID=UPI001FBB590C|nr:hypothetical protein [Methylobacterium sp. J-078]MCJ2047034.1 hypothetical protein [Methylobacterium sp. J-078]